MNARAMKIMEELRLPRELQGVGYEKLLEKLSLSSDWPPADPAARREALTKFRTSVGWAQRRDDYLTLRGLRRAGVGWLMTSGEQHVDEDARKDDRLPDDLEPALGGNDDAAAVQLQLRDRLRELRAGVEAAHPQATVLIAEMIRLQALLDSDLDHRKLLTVLRQAAAAALGITDKTARNWLAEARGKRALAVVNKSKGGRPRKIPRVAQ